MTIHNIYLLAAVVLGILAAFFSYGKGEDVGWHKGFDLGVQTGIEIERIANERRFTDDTFTV
jgi:hypothetical protein